MDDNERNLVWFAAPTMRTLYAAMDTWQTEHRKRLQSVAVQRDDDEFCCIALTNPTEVVITDYSTDNPFRHAGVEYGRLRIKDG